MFSRGLVLVTAALALLLAAPNARAVEHDCHGDTGPEVDPFALDCNVRFVAGPERQRWTFEGRQGASLAYAVSVYGEDRIGNTVKGQPCFDDVLLRTGFRVRVRFCLGLPLSISYSAPTPTPFVFRFELAGRDR